MKRLRWLTSPTYGSRRYRIKKWAHARALMTRRTHERELTKARAGADAAARKRIEEVKSAIDKFLPGMASAVVEFDHEQQAFRLTTFVGDAMVREFARYPGERDRMWEYVGERLGHEGTRQLRTLDFATIMQGPRILIGDRFINPYGMPPRSGR